MYYSKDALTELLSFGPQVLLSRPPPLTSPTSTIHQSTTPRRAPFLPFSSSSLSLLVHARRHNPVRVNRTTDPDDIIIIISIIVVDQRAVHRCCDAWRRILRALPPGAWCGRERNGCCGALGRGVRGRGRKVRRARGVFPGLYSMETRC
jgi:hypothetical protein